MVARETGISRSTIALGIRELQDPNRLEDTRIRKTGGGRKRTVDMDTTLKSDIESLIEPFTLGDPESPLRWTCKSVRNLATELNRMGHKITHRIVAELLHEMKYSLQGNQKVLEGESHPDRNAQFEAIATLKAKYQADGNPVLSMDVKKKELIGNLYRAGRLFTQEPIAVYDHDFSSLAEGVAIPHGLFDIVQNIGYVVVGTSHDTSEFACDCILGWWEE